MRKAAVVIFALAGVAFLATPLTSFAGGTVTGKVTYSGKAEEKEFLFSKFPNPKFCPKNPNPELVKGEKRILPTIQVGARSEEHTSELQSQSNLVCRLLLEKKKD